MGTLRRYATRSSDDYPAAHFVAQRRSSIEVTTKSRRLRKAILSRLQPEGGTGDSPDVNTSDFSISKKFKDPMYDIQGSHPGKY